MIECTTRASFALPLDLLFHATDGPCFFFLFVFFLASQVELTEVQKQYYRAIYEQNTTFLLQGKKRAQDGPSLMNLAMQLRKCCNHPYLIT